MQVRLLPRAPLYINVIIVEINSFYAEISKEIIKSMIKKLLILIGFLFLLWPAGIKAAAGEYISDFNSKITVNTDSSLDIQEEISYFFPAPKHGIFRIIPTQVYKTTNQPIKTPIKLIRITDGNNNSIDVKETNDSTNHTISWQIGDANKTIEGLQTYKIHYTVQNVIRFGNANFDEFYWNLNGNFWQVPINKFTADITFPAEVTRDNTEISIYSGAYGAKDANLATSGWNNNTLEISSQREFVAGSGLTVSVTTPKNIFTPVPPTFWEKYGAKLQYLFLVLPLLMFLIGFALWTKYGRDPKIIGPIVPEFGIPEDLSPLEMGVLIQNGGISNNFISAAIVNLAVKKVIKIEETTKKKYTLILLDKNAKVSESEKILIDKLFDGKEKVALEDLKNEFYEDIPAIHKNVSAKLKKDGLITEGAWYVQIVFIALAILFFILMIVLSAFNAWLTLSFIFSIIFLIIFTIIMPRRTVKGATLMKKVEGFKLYMKTAERYRQEFNEKENIFEKYLPYAMVFGIVNEWTKSFAKIYQEIHHQDYFTTYHPVWFMGIASGAFNPDIFSANISSMTSQMSSTLSSSPSSSGVGGGGFSGGGGGGGGGGSW